MSLHNTLTVTLLALLFVITSFDDDIDIMSSSHVIESNTIGNNVRIHQGNVIHNYASAPCEPRVLIPFLRNEELICRRDIIDKLDSILPPSDESSTAALYGLGGSGKTQIALDFAYRRCQASSCSVFWVHADNETTFIQDFKAIAKKLGLSTSLEGEEFLTTVRDGIESNPPWVLILDNADNLGLFGVDHSGQDASNRGEHALNLEKFIPRGPRGQVLWTSRDERIAGGLVAARRAIEIPKMAPDEAKELFESIRNNQENSDAAKDVDELLEELEWLPLAISQAAAYMKKTLTSVEKYVERLKDETWNISMNYLQAENKMAYQILHIHAFLDNQNIPTELIKQAALYSDGTNDTELSQEAHSDDSSSDSDREDDEILEAVVRLCDFSFLNVQASGDGNRAYEMHKLVQEAMRYGLGRKERKKEEEYFLVAALEITTNLFPGNRLPEEWNECDKYITHAQRACDNNTETMKIMATVAITHHLLGKLEESGEMMEKVARLRQEILGNEHYDTLQSKRILATIYSDTVSNFSHRAGKYKEAEESMTKALILLREVFGHKDPNTLWSMGKLAMIYQRLGRDEEAEGLAVETLALMREVFGDMHPYMVDTTWVLAIRYHTVGRQEEAEEMRAKTLELQRRITGDDSPPVVKLAAYFEEVFRVTDTGTEEAT
ncbi:uncharacterized protein Triagg1_10012 [Trichoderma aggressivum f. europaeum]|uniref:AAA+ ATPase domain-containing protein n=1 Tax=Trichoderma aggressivum f. europaeum TaxID=173218 RepID=A0AAE1LV84_9HYPO|nr:hypothetical protein Triagg1_10012 [Trichoderma aggressivum f. europaeum]